MPEKKPLLITAGEPAGIGAELIIHSLWPKPDANNNLPADKLVLADAGLIQRAASNLNYSTTEIDTKLKVYESITDYQQANVVGSELSLLHIPMSVEELPGELNVLNSQYVLSTLQEATRLCLAGLAIGIVTGPIHKGIINKYLRDQTFTGHTEYLAALSATKKVVMMLATEGLRVALVTTHLPLKNVAAEISRTSLTETLTILYRELQNTFAISSPRIIVCGLNPHAGEDGYLGMEEIETIIPVLDECRAKGMNLIGPLPADTAFIQNNIAQSDAILAMYHDQGLPVLKHLGFGRAINITLGLPFVRTSVDHGTALDIAGLGQANPDSMRLALTTAEQLTNSRQLEPK